MNMTDMIPYVTVQLNAEKELHCNIQRKIRPPTYVYQVPTMGEMLLCNGTATGLLLL